MTIENWLKLAKEQIDALDAELILLFVLKDALPRGADRSYIFAHPTIGISMANWNEMDELVERRRKGEPLAYILGMKEFYGRNFEVDDDVLIPRPETENLVDLVLELIDGKNKYLGLKSSGGARSEDSEKAPNDGGYGFSELEQPTRRQILEIGTGSGCIATVLDLEMRARGALGAVTAVDVSQAALEKAQKNAERLGANVQFLESDLLENVKNVENFDILVANLPYVDRNWEWIDEKNLAFEPDLALYAGEKGLALYRRLFEGLKARIEWVILEADPCQHEELIELASRNGYGLDKVSGFGVRLKKK